MPAMLPPEHPSSTDAAFESAESVILGWDSSAASSADFSLSNRMVFAAADRREVDRYLEAVDALQRSMSSASIADDDRDKAEATIRVAMARLEDEFRSILVEHSRSSVDADVDLESLLIDSSCSRASRGSDFGPGCGADDSNPGHRDPDAADESSGRSSYRSTNSIREIDLIPAEAIADLRCIAERMIAGGFMRECVQVYGSVRKSSVEAGLGRLGVEKLSIGDIQRLEWEAVEAKIRRWIRAAKVCVRVLYASEKRLCEHIFGGIGTATDDACFMETVRGSAIHLFNFAEAISISHRSSEKLFRILDLYDALSDLLPDIGFVFGCKSSEPVRVQAAEILSRLADAARGILSVFENDVLCEPSQVPVPGGTVHPLTRYVMNYISLISDYKQALLEVIVSKPATGSRYSSDPTIPEIDFAEHEGRSPLALHLIWITVVLQSNLETKSKYYRDASLSHLFLMNNVHYIVHKIKGSPELREMIGDSCLRKLTGKYRQAATSYQRATWVKVLYSLRDEGLHVSGNFSSGVSKSVLRERFKSFNATFEEVHRTQATWLIPDSQLREELQILISENLIPAYRSFLGRYRAHIESGRHPEAYIKYSVEDIENAVLDFFEGRPISQNLRRGSH